MANPIVTVNVSLTQPPAPNNLQKTGAIISQGGTVLSTRNYSIITQPSDLTALLPAPLAISSISWASTYGGLVSVVTTAPHGVTVNESFVTQIAGVVPAGYNGTFLATATGASAFTFYLGVNPGVETSPGTYTARGVGDLVAAVTTFFGQGSNQSVYVLECGVGEPSVGIANLSAFISSQVSQVFYAYLVPRNWDGVASFLTLAALFENPNAQTYFFTTTTLQNYAVYPVAMKSIIPMIEAPNIGAWPADTVTGASWTSSVATITTTTNHGVVPGQYFSLSGISPTGYNGTFLALPGTTGSTLVYALGTNPGAFVSGGTLVASFYSSAGVPATEFSMATYFQLVLSQTPGASTPVSPFAFSFLFGVTPFPVRGLQATIAQLNAASISYVSSANFGGLSQNMLFRGYTIDGKPFNFWFAVDWLSINLAVNLANEVINGSNSGFNPLLYNQQGINRLEQRSYSTVAQGIEAGLFLGTVTQYGLTQANFNNNINLGAYAGNNAVNAVPFGPYATGHPNDYAQGIYSGLSAIVTPQLGFTQIVFNLNATEFVG